MRLTPIFLILLIPCASALTLNVQGDFIVGHKLVISTDKQALIVIRLNGGTPIYANTTAFFTPHVEGTLTVTAISGEEIVTKSYKIASSSGGGGGLIGRYYLPDGTTTVTLEDGSKATVNWRTALGILVRASQEEGFSLKIKKWSYGLFVDCIGGICTKALGSTSGWMYEVNGNIPMVSAEQYSIKAGDTVVWFFSRSMNETSQSSPYKVELKTYDDWSFDVEIVPSMPWQITHPSGGTSGGTSVVKKTVEREVRINVTERTFKAIVKGNASLKVNVTKIPLNLTISTRKPIEIVVKERKPVGLIFSEIYGDVLDTFEIETNSSPNVTLSFKLPKSVNPKDVCLAEYKGFWKFIPTNYTVRNESYVFTVNLTNFSLFAIVEKWEGFPLKPNSSTIVKALNWLRREQRDDGGWGSLANTSWVVMAIASANQNPLNWSKNGKNPLDYFKAHLNESTVEKMGTSDFARTILALIALNQNPYDFNGINFVKLLKERVKPNGQIGDYIYTTIWGIIALRACGENVTKSVEWLKEHQNKDGGFAWALNAESDFDDTASAIMALIAGNVSRDDVVIKNALKYLKSGQNDDGGMRYFGNSSSNSASDSWTIWALVSANVNPMEWRKNNKSVVDHLLSLQTKEGYFKYTKYTVSNPIYMTSCAIIALTGKTHPIKLLTTKATPSTNVTTFSTTTTIATTVTTPIEETTTVHTVEKTETVKVTNKTTQPTPGFEVVLAILVIAGAILRR